MPSAGVTKEAEQAKRHDHTMSGYWQNCQMSASRATQKARIPTRVQANVVQLLNKGRAPKAVDEFYPWAPLRL